MQQDFEQNIIKKEEFERELKLKQLKDQHKPLDSEELQNHRIKYQNILKEKKDQLRWQREGV